MDNKKYKEKSFKQWFFRKKKTEPFEKSFWQKFRENIKLYLNDLLK
jgi:hypothetical protein